MKDESLNRDLSGDTLRESEARYRHLVENASDIIYTQDLEGRLLSVNAAGEKLFGYTREEAKGMMLGDFIAPEHRQMAREMTMHKLAHGGTTTYTVDVITRAGRRVPVEVSTQIIFRDGKPVGVQGIARDITDRQRAAEALEQSERYFRTLTENSADAITILNADGSIRYSSPSVERQLGFTPEERRGQSVFQWVHPDDMPIAQEMFEQLRREPAVLHHAVLRARHRDGGWRHIDFRVRNLMDDPDIQGVVLNWQDITERIDAEQRLKQREHFFRSIIERSSDILVVLDAGRVIRYVSPSVETILGYAPEAMVGKTGVEFVNQDDTDVFAAMAAAIFDRGEASATSTIRARTSTGDIRYLDVRAQNLLDDPLFHGVVVDARDISESKRIESALRTSEERFRKIIETSGEGIAIRDPAGALVFANRRLAEMLGYALEEMVGLNMFDLVSPEFRRAMADSSEHRKKARDTDQLELEFLRKDGSRISVILNATALYDSQDKYQGALNMFTDITQWKQLEAQLRQSQKIEAVGRLAGGIAHDFNNLLTAIRGHVELLLSETAPETPLHGDISEIRKAADRAAALTQQLLAFSRRQILQPRVIEIDQIVLDMNTLLRRLIGEDIQLATHLHADNACVRADPGQVEQVLLNLAVNARDAMPHGGILNIETRVVELDEEFVQSNTGARAGRHLRLTVTDTGEGMDPETLSHVFEPFFTTKELGKGTGLGLATVYGIIKQSGGYIRVTSERATGTRFEIFLPVVHELPIPARESGVSTGAAAADETVLVSEDEDAVRALACRVLRKRGYQVLEAADGMQALEIARSHAGDIDILLTDVVMPIMGGRELAERLLAERPRVRVLFMSGYTDDALLQRGVSQGSGGFIEKPFTPDSLLAKVREVLETAK